MPIRRAGAVLRTVRVPLGRTRTEVRRQPQAHGPELPDQRFLGLFKQPATGAGEVPELDREEMEPDPHETEDRLIEFRISMPSEANDSPDAAEHLLTSLPRGDRPAAFEVIGTPESIAIQIACAKEEAALLQHHLSASFPTAVAVEVGAALEQAFPAGDGGGTTVVQFGLSEGFMLPLKVSRSFRVDPLSGIAAASRPCTRARRA